MARFRNGGRHNCLLIHLLALKLSTGDAGELSLQLQQRDDSLRTLSLQVQQLEAHLRYAQDQSANAEQYYQAVQERDQLIESLSARTAELEQQVASIPPPTPSDQELAGLADELERGLAGRHRRAVRSSERGEPSVLRAAGM